MFERFPPIKVTQFRKDVYLHEEDVNYHPGDVAVINYPADMNQKGLQINSDLLKVRPISEYFKPFQHPDRCSAAFVHMTEGIGDYFFFSAVAKWLQDNGIITHVFVDPKSWPVFEWFESEVVLHKFVDPIIKGFNPFIKYPLSRLCTEYAGIIGRDRLWISCLFDRMNVSPDESYLRARIKTERLKGPKLLQEDSIMICHRASSPSRTSRFEDFYEPIRECYPETLIYVNEIDLSKDDKVYIDNCVNVEVLPRMSLRQHLLNLFDVGFVVSTDTSAIHFREGVGRPALGVYASMETKSRVLHYKHTKSFDVISDCKHQPCYFHQFKPDDRCRMGGSIAKCQSGESFKQQLKSHLK